MRHWFKVFGLVAVLLAIAMLLSLLGVYRASRHVPEFYQRALAADPVIQTKAGDDLERTALELTNDVQEFGTWEARFAEEQVNGWLAVDMPEKFPDLLPAGVTNPRVAVEEDEIQVACRYSNGQIDTVISLGVTVALTEEENVVAVRVRRARAGALPIPLTQFLDRITQLASRADIDVRWSQVEGDPVALVRLPAEHTHLADRTLVLEAFELHVDEAYLRGRTDMK